MWSVVMSSPWLCRRGIQHVFLSVACVALALPAAAEDAASGSNSEIETLDALALENNQSLRAFDNRARQAREQAQFQEQRRPEPMVEYMLDVSAPWMPHFTTGHMIRVMQSIPRGGARRASAAPARARQQVVYFEQREAEVELLRDLRLDVVELARIEARIELLEEEMGLIDDALGVVEAVTPLGKGDHGDFFQLELERETAEDGLARLRSERKARRATMAARMGVDVERVDALEFPADILEQWLVDLPTKEELVERAREGEPSLARLDAEAGVADARIELVDQRQRPWPQVMAGYSNMPPMWEMDGSRAQMFQLGISIALPIFGSQYDHEASQWQAAHQAVQQDRAQQNNEIRGQIEELMAGWNADRQRLQRHERELAPLASDLARRVLIGMELGERSASEYLLAVRQEVDLETRMIELRADLLERLMELQRLTGGALGEHQPWSYPDTAYIDTDGGQR